MSTTELIIGGVRPGIGRPTWFDDQGQPIREQQQQPASFAPQKPAGVFDKLAAIKTTRLEESERRWLAFIRDVGSVSRLESLDVAELEQVEQKLVAFGKVEADLRGDLLAFEQFTADSATMTTRPALEKQRAGIDAKITTAKASAAKISLQISDLQRAAAAIEVERKAAEVERESVDLEIVYANDAERRLRSESTISRFATGQREELQKRVNTLEQQRAEAERVMFDLRSQVSEWRIQSPAAAESIKGLTAQRKRHEEHYRTAGGQQEALESEVRMLNQQILQHHSRYHSDEQIAAKESERDTAAAKVEKIAAQLLAAKEELTQLVTTF